MSWKTLSADLAQRTIRRKRRALLEIDRAIDKVRRIPGCGVDSNAAQIASLDTDDALVLYPNQPAVSGKAAITGYFQSFFAEFFHDGFTLTSEEVEIASLRAFDRGAYRWKARPKAAIRSRTTASIW